MAGEVLDRRTALEEAFDSAEADAKGEVYTPPVREAAPEKEETDTPEVDPAKVEAEAAEKPEPKERPRTRGVPPDERKAAEPKPEGTADQAAAADTGKAPLGWGPTRDVLWGKTPVEVRAAISRREKEIQQGMSQAGRIRQVAEEYHQVIAPFENVIRSIGTTPRQALTSVMQTATAMIVGTQEQKCAVLAEMVNRYKVDLPMLDKFLTEQLNGKKSSGGTAPAASGEIDPRIIQQLQPLFQLQKRLQEQEGTRHEALQNEAAEHINSIAGQPYFEDLREDMADIMEYAAKRGRILSIQDAYQKAAEMHPEVSKLIPRQAPAANGKGGSKIERARRAGSTVKGSPGAPVSAKVGDRRSALEAAWDSQ